MCLKLGKVCLTAIGWVGLTSVAAFAHEAPVVDVQQQQNSAVSTQTEGSTGGAWQPVSSNSGATEQNASWQPVGSPGNGPQGSGAEAQRDTQVAPPPVPTGTVDQRVARLEQQVSNYSQMNMPQQISDLQQKVSELQGKLEVDQRSLKTLTEQQRTYYQDLEQQVAQLKKKDNKTELSESGTADNNPAAPSKEAASSVESPSALAASGALAVKSNLAEKGAVGAKTPVENKKSQLAEANVATQANPVPADDSNKATQVDLLSQKKLPSLSDSDSYGNAFRSLSNKHFNEAQTGFHQYLQDYPKGRFAVNAHFWLGEIALMHEHYNVAATQFQTVVAQYPTSTKVPDAKLKIAMIHAATGKMDVARTEFMQIRKSYPGTTAAQLASIRLQQLANVTSVTVQ